MGRLWILFGNMWYQSIKSEPGLVGGRPQCWTDVQARFDGDWTCLWVLCGLMMVRRASHDHTHQGALFDTVDSPLSYLYLYLHTQAKVTGDCL